ncbi:MAG: Gfo/Idh/MocA family protein [Rubripirellula sp.]
MSQSTKYAVNRRRFIASAAISAPLVMTGRSRGANERSANDRIQVGVIGLGSRGYNLVDDLIHHSDRAQIVAVCDVDQKHHRDREWGKGNAFGLLPGKKKIESAYRAKETTAAIATYTDYRELLARDDVDAVVIATPDHWHARCTLDALQSGKDVYCEKPVTHLFAEGQRVYQEVAKQQAVFQTGSQQRSDWRFRRAAELVRNGLLGEIREFHVGLPPGYDKPQGSTEIVETPETLDYGFWCGPAPLLPYMRARHHRWWRGHRAFGGGVLMDWIGHHNDIAHWAIGVDQSGPQRVEAVDWTFPEGDDYNTPHQYTIRCEYDADIQSTISSRNEQGVRLIGSDGWAYVRRGKLQASDPRWTKESFVPGEQTAYKSDNHMGNFLDCVRTRKSCIAPAETAHRSITPGHLGYVSQSLGRALQWDAENESVIDDEEANKLLHSVEYRQPWTF